MNQCFTGLRD